MKSKDGVATQWRPSDGAAKAYALLNPYPLYGECRRAAPVRRIGPDDPEAGTIGAISAIAGRECFCVFTAELIARVARDTATFSSVSYEEVMTWGRTILSMDEPEHSLYRGLVQGAFQQRALSAWYEAVVPPIMRSLVDAFAANRRADLVADLTSRFPFDVIATLLGIPRGDHQEFKEWTLAVVNALLDPARSIDANEKIRAYFAPVLHERRKRPTDDLVSTLVTAQVHGRMLTDEEIDSFILLLFAAGSDTTYYSSSNLFHALLSHPEQLAAVRNDRALIPKAVEEVLRWETGAPQFNIRRVVHDTMLGGVRIPAGADVIIIFGSQLRDEALYSHPERFDIFRTDARRAAFGQGPHTCLGNHLARLEMGAALSTVLDRMPGVSFDPECDIQPIEGIFWRGPASLPVVW